MLLSPGLDYSLKELDGIRILGLSGSITIIGFDILIPALHNLTERDSLIIDMESIDFLTSSGINALVDVSYYAKEHGNRVILMHIDNDLVDLIDFVDCYRHFIFAESFEEAKTKIEYYI
ncbi:MAG: STAS domain-containing protein [Spirochaetes bacterium]|nr:STAS domain-containing protein [Spirochaetota bacterium]